MTFARIDRMFRKPASTMVPRVGIPDFVRDTALRIEPVGSRVTCSPPPTDTDEDWLILMPDITSIHHQLKDEGWRLDGSFIKDEDNKSPSDHIFHSYSLAPVNLIMTRNPMFFGRFMAASSVAKRLNLMDKDDRIALFQAVLYGNRCDVPDPSPLTGGT